MGSECFPDKCERDRLLAELAERRSTIDRLQAELAKCQAANASWQESYCKRHNDSIERLERAKKAESALAAANARADRAEAHADSLRTTIDNMRAMNIKLTFEATGKVLAAEAEAKALREALQFYANKAYYEYVIIVDNGDKARAALASCASTKQHQEPPPCSKT